MELTTVRVIPWDVGTLLQPSAQQAIRRTIETIETWRLLDDVAERRKSCFLVADLQDAGSHITLSIHDDGVAIFEIVEPRLVYEEIEDFDPATLADLKRAAHAAILSHTHTYSPLMLEAARVVRATAGARRARKSAELDWENQGFSYVFSYFLLDLPGKERAVALEDRLARVLYPLHSQRLDDKLHIASIDLTWPLERHLLGANIASEAVEMRPGLRVLASWSAMCVIGNITPEDEAYFRTVQVAIQHCWFFCYIMVSHIEEQFSALRTGARPSRIAELDQEIADLKMKLAEVRHVRSSTARTSEFLLFDHLLSTSRIDALMRRIDETATVFQERYTHTLEERRARSARVIEALLFLFAAISAVDAYFSIRGSNGDARLQDRVEPMAPERDGPQTKPAK